MVALYAIAMSLQNKQRVIYTSPIKALSNQKYREFKEELSDVGLMAGDVTIDPKASCLVGLNCWWDIGFFLFYMFLIQWVLGGALMVDFIAGNDNRKLA